MPANKSKASKQQEKQALDWALLQQLCAIHAPSGDEGAMTRFLLSWLKSHVAEASIIAGPAWHDNIMVIKGRPSVAVFAHIDSTGFTVRYDNKLVLIGGPEVHNAWELQAQMPTGELLPMRMVHTENLLTVDAQQPLPVGTTVTFAPTWLETKNKVTSNYLDNRLGVFMAMNLLSTEQDVGVVFSTYEEHRGGAVPALLSYLVNHHGISNALICDVTWSTEGVIPGQGPAISMRDSRIPRQFFVRQLIASATKARCPFQLEVEASGGSDGAEVQSSPWLVDWCFVGPPVEQIHTPYETVHKTDVKECLHLYHVLIKELTHQRVDIDLS